MVIRIDRYHGYQLALHRENNLFQIMISDSAGNPVASGGFAHVEAESALAEARRFVDALRTQRRR
jgi:hypothetical protein